MFDRDKTVELLVEDDIDTIKSMAEHTEFDYLYDILSSGFKGYNNYTDLELVIEFSERFGDK